jgi:hypothetical protein
MQKAQVVLVAAGLALAAVLGTIAATKTVSLGSTQRHSSDAAVTARTKQLDRFEASLRRALAKKTPALPKMPKAPVIARPAVSAVAPRPRVVYRRPPPVVVVRHVHHGDDGGHEAEGGGGGDD